MPPMKFINLKCGGVGCCIASSNFSLAKSQNLDLLKDRGK